MCRTGWPFALSFSLALLAGGEPSSAFQDVPQTPGPRLHAAAGAGATKVSFSSTRATLRVDDGGNLDQYLSRDAGPIRFSIDFQGFQPDPEKATPLKLSVWDVDEEGSPSSICPVELDVVKVNGAPVGKLTGANNQDSFPIFEIRQGIFTSGVNQIEIEIDVLGEHQQCWAVQVNWAEVEIPFNLEQVEAKALGDVEILDEEGTTIQDPIWKTEFDDEGGHVFRPAAVDHPIAVAIQAGPTFQYRYTLAHWPEDAKPDWPLRVDYTWTIEGSDKSGEGTLTEWENTIEMQVPSRTGKYKLRVTLEPYAGDLTLQHTQVRSHTLYVLWDRPAESPKENWIDIATQWGGGDSEDAILTALLDKVHSNPYNWVYGPNGGIGRAKDLIENKSGTGDCQSFTGVWMSLAEVLGIQTQRADFDPDTGFLTLPAHRALDNNNAVNALNLCIDKRDRWYFGAHAYGYAGNSFYDPTFHLKGAYVPGAGTGNVYCQENATTNQCDDPSSHLPVAIVIPQLTLPWKFDDVHFRPIADCPQEPAQDARPAASLLEGSTSARITGVLGEQGHDPDGNGLSESLRIDLGVEVFQEGIFAFDASLINAEGELVARGSVLPQLPIYTLVSSRELSTRRQTVSLYFEGKAIRSSDIDGPYSIRVRLLSEEGVLDTFSSVTNSYSHDSFQGALAELRNLSDMALSADTRPGAELLRVQTDLNVLGTGEIAVQAQLMAGETWLGNATLSRRFEPGIQKIDLDFSGPTIFAAGKDGPYTVLLSATDPYYVVNARHTTAAYRHGDFQAPDAFLTGTRDSGSDADGDGRFETLDLTASLDALGPGTYRLHGTLEDAAGRFIAASTAQASLVPGSPMEAKLAFDGLAIGRHGMSSPYQATLVLSGTAGPLMRLQHTTAPYSSGSFVRPGATLSGSVSETAVDADRNNLFESLRLDVGVSVAAPGTYVVAGSLFAADGTFVAAARREVLLASGPQTVGLTFAGATLRARRTDGPYQLAVLDLRQPGGRFLDNQLDAHTTAAFTWMQFQPSGPELATTADRGEDTNGNGLFDRLAVTLNVLILRSGTYSFNARLVDSHGQQIGWASGSQSLAAGTRSITLRFDGRRIYGNGTEGPYSVRDLALYSGSEVLSSREVHTTSPYDWQAFEPSGVIQGTVTLGDEPLEDAYVVVNRVGSDRTDADGSYRLAVLQSGTYTVELVTDPDLAPWDISVDGTNVGEGVSTPVQVIVGRAMRVDFSSAVACEIYPIALHRDTLAGAVRGQELDILNGAGPGQFGWLSWTGDPSNEALLHSLNPPGNVDTYVSPTDPADRQLSRGDWISGLPGVRSSRGLRDALDRLKSKVITVPIWEETEGRGANLRYRITGFAQVEILDIDVSGPHRISVIYRRPVVCRGR